ncbi:MAG TPA: AAA family ATPase [Acinetobacter lwoffii]|uniref:AAA family ATPase n=2 Tax=Acinetobacter TaxID=469 RepID=A0A9D2ZZ63_ACILW|nr:AAA family ATPase [Acinetobacter lwoffii]
MNAKIPCDKTIDMFGGVAPLAVSTDPVTGNKTEYHSIEDFIKGCIDEQHFKVKPESYIYSKLPDYNCEECEALPLVNPNKLTEVIGYGIRGTAKKYDISQTPCKEIDSKKISFSIGKAGVFASNTNNKYMPYVLGTDNIDLFVQLAKAGEAVVLHKDIDTAYQIINKGMPETVFRLMAGKSTPQHNSDLFVQLDDSFKKFTKADIKKLFLEKVNQLKQSIDHESFIQPPAEEKPLLDQQVDKGQVSLQIVNMATIQAQAINWLWSGWLPLGKLTILAGAGGCGKTNLLLALIATITTNGIFPDGSKCTDTGKVLIYSTEDDPNDTLLPRLIANGADLSKIDFIAGRINDKGEREPFDPTKDLPLLNAYAKQNPDIKLLMIDPIISAVGGDSNKATDVRRSLQVVVDFAQEFNCAVVGITHFAKGTSGSSPAERIIGSQAFTALARMVWSAAKREDENDCILVRAKSNISTLDGGIKYQIEPETVLENIETTKTAWLGTIEGSARELLSEAESTENSNGTTVDMAKEFLIDLLSSVENMPSKEVQSQAKDAGFSPASIRRAQEKLNIKPFKPQGEKIWFWSLPKIHRLDEPTHF